jgi:outer membrane lipoprotein-sorting protein
MKMVSRGTTKHLLPVLLCFWILATLTPSASKVCAAEGTAGFRHDAFIKGMIAAYGGEKALAKIKTMYTKGSIRKYMQEEKGISTRYFKRPRKLRVELFYPLGSEIRVINGFHGWRGSDSVGLREVHGPPYLAMAYQFKYLDLPFGFLDKGYRIDYLGRESVNGVPMEVLQVVDDEGPTMRISVDAGTHLITRVAATFGFGPVSTELSAEFSDYRDIEGIKVPFKVINYSGSNLIAETVIIEIRFNGEMPDSLFQP